MSPNPRVAAITSLGIAQVFLAQGIGLTDGDATDEQRKAAAALAEAMKNGK